MKRYVNATLSRRFGAFLLDAFSVVFLATLLYSLFAQVIVRMEAFSEANKIMNEILVESHLYKYSEDEPNEVELVSEKYYAVVIEKYYIEYKNDEETYHSKMMESNLFNNVDGEYVKKAEVSDSAISEFYKNFILEIDKEVKADENYRYCYVIGMNFVFYNIFISCILSYFTLIILVPSIFKRRCTLGQRAMNLALVHSETYELATRTQLIFRAFIILLIEIVISLFSYGIPAIISIGFIILTKDKVSFHDKLSATKLIDYHYVEIDDKRKEGKK